MSRLPGIRVVGITGKKYAGKDTTANYLCGAHGFTKLSFAAPLKTLCIDLFGFSEAQVNGDEKEIIDKKWNATPRHIMQCIGTDFFRNYMGKLVPGVGQDFWIIHMKKKIQEMQKIDPKIRIVFSDVRFQNEIDFIHAELNGEVWRVTKNQTVSDKHESENNDSLLDIDKEIINYGDGFKNFYETVEKTYLKSAPNSNY